MAEKLCPVCGDQVQSRMACIMEHFAFYQPGTLPLELRQRIQNAIGD